MRRGPHNCTIELQAAQIHLPVAGALQVRGHQISSVVRAVDTTNGQLSTDLIAKVESEDGLRASIHQTFHWSTNSVHGIPQAVDRETLFGELQQCRRRTRYVRVSVIDGELRAAQHSGRQTKRSKKLTSRS